MAMLINDGSFVTLLPWWVWLIVAVVIIVIASIIPWKKFRRKNSSTPVKKAKKSENDDATKSDLKMNADEITQHNLLLSKQTKQYYGLFNYFGKKTAWRNKPLIYVVERSDACRLCRPFENMVLTLDGCDDQYMTMREAISKGYHHLGCTHQDIDFYPGDTLLPTKRWTEVEQEERFVLRKRQYRFEAKLRKLKFNLDNCTKPKLLGKMESDLSAEVARYDAFCIEYDIKRNAIREDERVDFLQKWS